jgi:hypothetical protein
MADVKNIITLGIGASPGSLTWFITTGLESDNAAPSAVVETWTLRDRETSLTVQTRPTAWTVQEDDR